MVIRSQSPTVMLSIITRLPILAPMQRKKMLRISEPLNSGSTMDASCGQARGGEQRLCEGASCCNAALLQAGWRGCACVLWRHCASKAAHLAVHGAHRPPAHVLPAPQRVGAGLEAPQNDPLEQDGQDLLGWRGREREEGGSVRGSVRRSASRRAVQTPRCPAPVPAVQPMPQQPPACAPQPCAALCSP